MGRTIRDKVALEGVGVHTGERCRVVLEPAQRGIAFLVGDQEIPAHVSQVTDSHMNTSLGPIKTVEHLLSACAGLGVDALRVRVEGPEIPILDGSPLPFARAMMEVGLAGDPEPPAGLIGPLSVEGYRVYPSDGFYVTLISERPKGGITLRVDPETYMREIAPARTYVFEEDIDEIRQKGLGKGGSLENVLVIREDGSFLNQPRFPDEPIRHKVADLLGDVLLSGRGSWRAHIIAHSPGHAGNHELARRLSDEGLFGPTLEAKDIMEVLPHRYPFLMIDRVLHADGKRAVAVKNVTAAEAHFQGHFPGEPVMPGVLIMEALAQTGGVMMMGEYPPEVRRGKLALFAGMDEVRFKRPVRPGDTLYLETRLLAKRGRMLRVKARAWVDGQLAAEGVITAFVVDR